MHHTWRTQSQVSHTHTCLTVNPSLLIPQNKSTPLCIQSRTLLCWVFTQPSLVVLEASRHSTHPQIPTQIHPPPSCKPSLFEPTYIWTLLFTVWNYWLFLLRLQTPQKPHREVELWALPHLPWSLDNRLSITIFRNQEGLFVLSDHFDPGAKRSRFPDLGPAVRGAGDAPLTRRPRGFSTLGLREKCMHRVPSSLTVTDTFFSVLFPHCAQNTLLMSDVVLQKQRRCITLESEAANPIPRAQGESRASEEETQEMGTGWTAPHTSQTKATCPHAADISTLLLHGSHSKGKWHKEQVSK